MNVRNDVSLADYSTMRLGGIAKYLVEIESKQDLIAALGFATEHKLPTLMIGGGSNIIWKDSGFSGLIIVNKIRGLETENENDEGADLLIGAGENWDLVVDRAVSLRLSGIECLSLIPGTAGATPVQNVGAYGQEIAETLVSLEAYDNVNKTFLTMLSKDCEFSYRDSLFRNKPTQYYILSLRLHLNKSFMTPPFYPALSKYLVDNNISDFSPKSIREAVVAIRRAKLPDPAKVNNCGSFFKNPIISGQQFAKLSETSKDIPNWIMPAGNIKVSAAWLVEKAGFKDYVDLESGMATWKGQALILINQHAKSTADLISFRDKITEAVKIMFGIELTQEPQLLPLS